MPDTSDEPVAVILAGGQGSRLWPISRDRAPKQFQPVVRDRPLLTGTIERLSEIVDPSRIHVSTRARFADAARATLGPVPPENLILEEDPAGPATAFALSIATLFHKYGNAPALIAPSDHLITEEDAFNAASRDMLAQLERTPESMVVLGAEPTRFDPSLGYIHTKGGDDAVQVIDSFHEKPDEDVVERAGGVGQPVLEHRLLRRTRRAGLRRLPHRAAPHLRVHRAVRPRRDVRAGLPRRRHRRPRDLPAACGPAWSASSSRGSWGGPTSAPGRASSACWHDQRVTSIGPALQLDAEDTLVASMDGRPVVTLGARGLIVVTHEDAVYVLDRQKALDTGILERLRSLLAASTREDLL